MSQRSRVFGPKSPSSGEAELEHESRSPAPGALAYRMRGSSPKSPPSSGSPHRPGCPRELSALHPNTSALASLGERNTLSTQHSGPHSSAQGGWIPRSGPPARFPSPLTNSPSVYFQVCFLNAAPGGSRPPQGTLRSVTATLWQSVMAPKCRGPCSSQAPPGR